MKKTTAILFTALFLLTQPAHALQNIIRPYQSARSAGMGGVRITTGLYDENFFGNPARVTANPTWRVSLFNIMAETSSSTLDTLSDLTGSGNALEKISSTAGNNNHGRIQTMFPTFYIPHLFFNERNSLAFGIITSTQFDIALRKNYAIEPTAITDIGPALTFGRKFLQDEPLSVGITGHYTYRLSTQSGFSFIDILRGKSISPTESGGQGAHLEFDLGATYRLPFKIPLEFMNEWDINTGLSINNLLGGNYSNMSLSLVDDIKGRPLQQPRTFNFGASLTRAEWWAFSDAQFALEFTDIGNNPDGSLFKLLHLGGEIRWTVFRPRLGINQGYLCAGLGIDLKVLNLDLATYGEEMSLNVGGKQDRRYSLNLAIQI